MEIQFTTKPLADGRPPPSSGSRVVPHLGPQIPLLSVGSEIVSEREEQYIDNKLNDYEVLDSAGSMVVLRPLPSTSKMEAVDLRSINRPLSARPLKFKGSEWKFQNMTISDEDENQSPIPVVAVAVSSDGSKVAYGGTQQEKYGAPLRIYDLTDDREILIKRNALIVKLGFIFCNTLSNTPMVNGSVYWQNGSEGSWSENIVVADTQSLSMFQLPSCNLLFNIEKHKNIKDMAILSEHRESSFSGIAAPLGPAKHEAKKRALISICSNTFIHLVYPDSFEEAGEIKCTADIESIAFCRTHNSALLAASLRDSSVAVFEVIQSTSATTLQLFSIELGHRINSVCFSDAVYISGSNFNFLAVGGMDKKARVFSIECVKNKKGSTWEWEETYETETPETVSSVSITQDGKMLAVADDSRQVSVFDLTSGAQIHHFRQSDRVTEVCFSKDAERLAVGGFDTYLTIYDLHYGLQLEDTRTESSIIQSVSLSSDGTRVGFGTKDGTVKVYDLSRHNEQEAPIFFYKNTKQIWVVELSGDGEWLAAGGFDHTARVFVLSEFPGPLEAAEVLYNVNHQWEIPMQWFIWSLSLRKVEEKPEAKLVVGDWAGKVKVQRLFTSEDGSHLSEALFALSLKDKSDRIFSLSFNREADKLAIGTRSCTASVWSLAKDDPSLEPLIPMGETVKVSNQALQPKRLQKFKRKDRVYTVALSPDGSRLAVGGMDKTVAVYKTKKQLLLKEFKRSAQVNYVSFTFDGAYLGAVGEDRLCVIYCMKTLTIVLQQSKSHEISSISFSSGGSMAIASGHGIFVFGKGENSYGITARPSYRYAESFLDRDEELQILVKSHPTIPNCRSNDNQQTLLHRAVELQLIRAVEILLATTCTLGLIPNIDGVCALGEALKRGQKEIVTMLLRAVVSKKICNTPGTMQQITKQRGDRSLLSKLGEMFPDLYLQFLAELKMEEAGLLVQGNIHVAPLSKEMYVCCKRRAPTQLWQTYLATKYEFKEENLKNKTLQDKDTFVVAVKSYRVPIEDFSKAIKLRDVIKYAEFTKNLEVFREGTIVHSILEFKKPKYIRRFTMHLLIYVFYLLICIFWGYAASFTRHHSWEEILLHPQKRTFAWGITALILSLIVAICTLCYIWNELYQIFIEYSFTPSHSRYKKIMGAFQMYFNSIWNNIDICAFGLTTIGLVLFYVRHPEMHQLISAAVTMLCFKLLYYARALPAWSLVIRTMLVVIEKSLHVVKVIAVLICGIGCSYLILFGAEWGLDTDMYPEISVYFRNPGIAIYSVALFLFMQINMIDVSAAKSTDLLAMVLLMIFLIVCVLLLVNILIAKMGDAYGEVRERAELESNCEIARIIYELEQDRCKVFLPWLHVLRPVKSTLMGMKTTSGISSQLDWENLSQYLEKLVETSENNRHDHSNQLAHMQKTLKNVVALCETLVKKQVELETRQDRSQSSTGTYFDQS